MDIVDNKFKRALAARELQIGVWAGLPDPYCAEILAGAGFDWIVIDAEHGPYDLRTVLAQLQAMSAYLTHPIVRPADSDPVRIKQLLDLGAQTLVVPMIETAADAAAAVQAMRYPPNGVRGVGAALARASRWNSVPSYLRKADAQMCLIVQVESATALANIEEIAGVDGVDAVFIGPSDLAGSLGHLGDSGHAEVQTAIDGAIACILASGKPAGLLAIDTAFARRSIAQGVTFIGVGVDTLLLSSAARSLAHSFKPPSSQSDPSRPK